MIRLLFAGKELEDEHADENGEKSAKCLCHYEQIKKDCTILVNIRSKNTWKT